MIINEETTEDIRWFDVQNVPSEYNKLAIYNNDIYIPIESFNLTKANVVAYMTETNSGTCIVAKDKRVLMSGRMAIDMAERTAQPQIEELRECVNKMYTDAMEADLCRGQVNEIML